MNQEDMQIIGTLALEKDTKRKGVFINTKSAIQYVVKSMMSDYKSDKLFTGYMNSFENDQKFDDFLENTFFIQKNNKLTPQDK